MSARRKLSLFEIVSYVVIAVLVVTIVITAIIVADKKHKLDEMNRKNEEISQTCVISNVNNNYLNNFELKLK